MRCIELELSESLVRPWVISSGGKVDCACPNCGSALDDILSVWGFAPASVLGWKLGGATRLVLVYCWRCAMGEERFVYNWKTLEFAECHRDSRPARDPYAGYPPVMPTFGVKWRVVEIEKPARYRSYLWPRMSTGVWSGPQWVCPHCRGCMRQLASIWDPGGYPVGFSGGDTVRMHFSICEECDLIAASHEVD
jgi:hypothetical protein